MRYFKIILSVIFVIAVSFLVIKGCIPKKHTPFVPEVKQKIPLPKKVTVAPKPPVEKKTQAVSLLTGRKGKMAIILDDWGNNDSLLPLAIEIKRPLTLSILPNLPKSREIAEEAHQNGLGVMLHMPMQPKSGNQPLEPHTILTTTPDEQIKEYLEEALLSVPYVEGVNNHMGSAATSDVRVMRIVLGYLKSRSLFFVDSHVISQTVAPQVAKEVGIRFTKRDVFIDNELNWATIKNQLEHAKKIALKTGRVVVIGHDKKVTLQAIKDVAPEFEKQGIKFVLVKELVS